MSLVSINTVSQSSISLKDEGAILVNPNHIVKVTNIKLFGANKSICIYLDDGSSYYSLISIDDFNDLLKKSKEDIVAQIKK